MRKKSVANQRVSHATQSTNSRHRSGDSNTTSVADSGKRSVAAEISSGDSPDKVVVRVYGDRYVTVSPSVEVLREHFRFTERGFDVGKNGNIVETVEEVTRTVVLPSGELVLPAGLLKDALWTLHTHGIEFDRFDPTGKPPAVDESVIVLAEPEDKPALQAVVNEPWGQIEIRRDEDRLRLCCAICELFPESGFVVLVHNKRAVAEYAAALRTALNEPVAKWSQGRRRRRIIVALGSSMPTPDRCPEILLLPFAEKATGEETRWRMRGRRWSFRRVYALRHISRQLDRHQRLHLEQYVGPVISSPRRPRKRVLVGMLPTPADPVTKHETSLTWKRKAYWGNEKRNLWIAGIGAAFAENPDKALKRIFGRRIKPEDLFTKRRCRVAILVESAEHARTLARLLPDWRLAVDVDEVRRGLPCNSGNLRNVIATTTCASKNEVRCDVLIRATGTADRLCMTRFPPLLTKRYSEPAALLLDFTDAFHSRARRDAERRCETYRRNDYYPVPVGRVDFHDSLFAIPVSAGSLRPQPVELAQASSAEGQRSCSSPSGSPEQTFGSQENFHTAPF